jgi:hypothetical protein
VTAARSGGARRPAKVATTFLVTATALLAAGCGLPDDGTARVVDGTEVPYHLLEAQPSPGDSSGGNGPAPRLVPVVFWVGDQDQLVPTAVPGSCGDPADARVRDLLEALAAGPSDDVRAAGQASALPADVHLSLVAVEDGTALLDVDAGEDAGESVSADRLPLAVGQVVLSLTASAGVGDVQFRSDGAAMQVPLPGGALTSRAVSATDYAELVADRYLVSAEPPALSPEIGCVL